MADDILRIGYLPSYIPQSFDYTSRDYYSIRAHLIEVVKSRIPEWTGEDPSDFGLALVEAMAYQGDLMSYYIDRAGNEAFLPTATRRQSVINIARMLGYEPSRAVAAQGEVTFEDRVGSGVTIPKYTQVSAVVRRENGTDDRVTFTTDSEVSIPANTVGGVPSPGGTVTAVITEGYIADSVSTGNTGVALGVSDGSPDQSFDLPYTPVAAGTLEVYIFDGVTSTLWNRVARIYEYSALDNVFEARLAADGTVTVQFGDGVTGRIPPVTHRVSAKYRVGGGARGNLPAESITSIDNPSLEAVIDVVQTAPTSGGSETETTYSIRQNASTPFRANRRAVSAQDIESLARNVEGCYTASAQAKVWSNILLAVAPNDDLSLTPGMSGGSPTASQNTLRDKVKTDISPSLMIGSSLTVRDPAYVKVVLSIQVDLVSTAKHSFAKPNITSIFKDGPFSYERRGFGGSITMADVITAAITNTSYITGIRVVALHRSGQTGVVDVTAQWFEILCLDTADLTIDFGSTGINDL